MRVDNEFLMAAERRIDLAGLASTPPRREMHPRASASQKRRRTAHLRFAGATPSETEFERTLGANDLVDEFFLERALAAAQPVCRLTFRDGGDTGHATGFMVSPRLLLTNWHVFKQADLAEAAVAEFDYKLDIRGKAKPGVRFVLRPERCFVNHRALDYALVAVSEVDDEGLVPLHSFGYHRLVADTGKIEPGEWISIIQHPSGGYRQFAIRENELLAKEDHYLLYRSDTAPGSSGSPAFNDSFQVVALHHSGKARKEDGRYVLKNGTRVANLAGVDESQAIWEANEGVRVSVLVDSMRSNLNRGNPFIEELLAAIQSEQGDIMSNTVRTNQLDAARPRNASSRANEAGTSIGVGGASAGIVIPLQLHIFLTAGGGLQATLPFGSGAAAVSLAGVGGPEGEEALVLKQPFIETPYSSRKGYRDNFLGTAIPLPTVTDLTQVATMANGEHAIPYEHFSVVLHKQRKLALVTAWNVNGSPASRQPEPKPAGAYSRKGLTGLKNYEMEKWKTDPRLPAGDQIPDAFYTKDGGAFDKGHVVRREDVCWGSTYKQVRRGNGDTFHVTNCTPQVKEFNQSQAQGIWGELENFVLAQVRADKDKYCMFAGPLFSDGDRVFEGEDEDGAELRVAIPQKFWKVVVAKVAGALAAFAFLLEQDLTQVVLEDEEFKVTSEWTPYLVSVPDLEEKLGIVTFPQVLRDADRFGDPGGHEALRGRGVKFFEKKAAAPG